MIDTCQANTMYSKFYSPNIIATGSSEIDQSSYSHHADQDVGVAVIDRYTYYNLEFLETQIHDQSSKLNLGDLFDSYDESKIHSHPGVRYDLFPGGEKAGRERLVMDFFGNVQNVEIDSADGEQSTDLKEDFDGLARMITELASPNETERLSPSSVMPLNINSVQKINTQVAVGAVIVEGRGWNKQVVGATVVLGAMGIWFAGSMLESSN